MKIERLVALLEKCEDVEKRKPFLEVCLAVELSYRLELPPTKVDSVVTHFEQFHAELVKRVIGEVNEVYPISVNVCYNLVVDSYKNRYVLCHEPTVLSGEDICHQLCRATFEQSVTPNHLEAVKGPFSKLLRSDLNEFVGRFIA